MWQGIKNIKTSFCFFDETGLLRSARDPFFKKFDRLVVHGICRVYSKGVELIQLTDLLLGAIVYNFKLKEKFIPKPSKAKQKVLSYLKRSSGISDFAKDVRNNKFNVWIFKPKVSLNVKSGP